MTGFKLGTSDSAFTISVGNGAIGLWPKELLELFLFCPQASHFYSYIFAVIDVSICK